MRSIYFIVLLKRLRIIYYGFGGTTGELSFTYDAQVVVRIDELEFIPGRFVID